MTLPHLLIGMSIATLVFAALGWSVARLFQTQGGPRLWHGANAALIVLGMALISAEWPDPARIAGAALTIAGLGAAWFDPGWSRLLPLLGAGFGIALLLGLPFASS